MLKTRNRTHFFNTYECDVFFRYYYYSVSILIKKTLPALFSSIGTGSFHHCIDADANIKYIELAAITTPLLIQNTLRHSNKVFCDEKQLHPCDNIIFVAKINVLVARGKRKFASLRHFRKKNVVNRYNNY